METKQHTLIEDTADLAANNAKVAREVYEHAAEYNRDRLSFFKWLSGGIVSIMLFFAWFAWQKLDNMETQLTTLVAAQPFVLSNIDDVNKRIDEHITSDVVTTKRQDDELIELRHLIATLPERIRIQGKNNGNN